MGIGQAVGRPLAISFSRPATHDLRDAGHLPIQEMILGLAERNGVARHFELPTRPAAPALSVDVLLRLDAHRVLLIMEIWDTFGDLGAAVRTTHRKQAEASALAVVAGGDGSPYDVATFVGSSVTRPRTANWSAAIRPSSARSSRARPGPGPKP